MKAIYYLAPTLYSTRHISDDLYEAGVKDGFLHVLSKKDQAGLDKARIPSCNYLETLDLLRDAGIGAMIGFVAGMIAAGLALYFKPFGPDAPGFIYFIIIAVATLFGTWEGGLTGIASENKKLAKFHDDLAAGKYLILIYAQEKHEEPVKTMMHNKHPEAPLVATDKQFFNPFSTLELV